MSALLLPTARIRYTIRLPGWTATPRYLLAESRPAVQAIFLMRLAAGGVFVRHPTLAGTTAMGGWLMLTIAIYVFNGVTDMTTDRANGSKRPIATGQLSARDAQHWYRGIAVVGLGLCLFVGPVEFALGVGMLVIGWAYSAGPALKDSALGFATVIGAGAALTYSAGWVASGRVQPHDLATTLAVSLWVAFSCGSKDFSDVDGDRVAGRHTWPVVLGYTRAARLLAALAVIAAGCVVVTALGTGGNIVPAAAIGVGSLALAMTVLRSRPTADRRNRRRPYRVYMLTQYATNAALLICVAA